MRLDTYLTENNFFTSRNKAKESIERGEVKVDGKQIKKPSFDIAGGKQPQIEVVSDRQFVSLGGYKLLKAITDFNYDVRGKIAVDVGASTGGFSDCLLQFGAKKVYAVDLNDGLLSEKLKKDERVVPVIANARNLAFSYFAEEIDLITADLSFISETYVLKVFSDVLTDGKDAIILIKPQFELDEKIRLKNGIVKDEKIRKNAVKKIYDAAISYGFSPVNLTTAPIVDGKNVEYLLLLKKSAGYFKSFDALFNEK